MSSVEWMRYAIILITISFATSSAAVNTVDHDRPWTIKDSIGVSYFVQFAADGGPTGAIPGQPTANKLFHPVVFSPDRQHFFSVKFHGELETDRIVYVLEIYSAADVRRALMNADEAHGNASFVKRRIEVKAAYVPELFNGFLPEQAAQTIAQPYWENNRSIIFIGLRERAPHRLYRFDIHSGALEALTDEKYDVSVGIFPEDAPFAVTDRSVIFSSRSLLRPDPYAGYPMQSVSRGELQSRWMPQSVVRLYSVYRGAPAQPFATLAPGTSGFGPWPSPDGRWAVMVYVPENVSIPPRWLDYEVKPKSGYRFYLVDMKLGRARQILDAPVGTVTEAGRGRTTTFAFGAFWSADGRHVLLFNTALPLTAEQPERHHMAYMVDLHVQTGEWATVGPVANAQGEKIMEAQWLRPGKEILLARRGAKGTLIEELVLGFDGLKWIQRSANSTQAHPVKAGMADAFTVILRQSANDPPVLVASAGKRQLTLSGPDPALQGLRRAIAEPIEWQENEGKQIKGQLMLPGNRAQGERLPVVILGSDNSDPQDVFWPDGGSSGYAAQALVAAGFCVLQIPLAYDDAKTTKDTPQEGPIKVQRIDRAVEILKGRGIVDETRVGAVGFSRMGYMAYYAITHPGKTRLAAAAVLDSTTYGYSEYVFGPALNPEIDRSYEAQYGSGTLWENRAAWMEAPSFNLDRVTTPVLFTDHITSFPQLETVGAFRLARRPFDDILFPTGAHILQWPRERAHAMQAVVDWMSFWLLGRDPAPLSDDPSRGERWHEIRDTWQKTQAEEANRKFHGTSGEAHQRTK